MHVVAPQHIRTHFFEYRTCANIAYWFVYAHTSVQLCSPVASAMNICRGCQSMHVCVAVNVSEVTLRVKFHIPSMLVIIITII